MKLIYSSVKGVHNVFLDDPKVSPVCGIVKKLEERWYEWQIRCREGGFDRDDNKYRPSLSRYGYSKTREGALRAVIDAIKSGDWDA